MFDSLIMDFRIKALESTVLPQNAAFKHRHGCHFCQAGGVSAGLMEGCKGDRPARSGELEQRVCRVCACVCVCDESRAIATV